jgi:hypothetical protein
LLHEKNCAGLGRAAAAVPAAPDAKADTSAAALAVRKLRAPIGAATLGGVIEHGPDRPDEVDVAGAQAGVRGREEELAAEQQPAAPLCDRLGVPGQRDLLVEERIARGPVFV